jgi:hypothetical protein
MDHGTITARTKRKIADNRSNTKLVGTQHQTQGNGNKPAKRCFTGKTGFKMAQDFINKIHHNRMENH